MKWLLIGVAVLVCLYLGLKVYYAMVVNPRVVEELRAHPNGERAAKVMVMYFDDGAQIPVNYLREGDKVFAGSDGRWWRRFGDTGADVTMLIEGQMLRGRGIAIRNDPARTEDVFSRLRPTVPKWLPTWLDATLVEIAIQGAAPANATAPGDSR